MQKPITVARQELIERVSSAVNESGLPAFVVADVFRTFIGQLENLQSEQLRRDSEMWGKFVAEKENEQSPEERKE